MFFKHTTKGDLLREKPVYSDMPGLLNTGGHFVDATALLAIWPRELDEWRVLVCQLADTGALEYYTLFEPEHGTRDEHGEWAGKDVILTRQVC